jgi:hypothetical protein
MRWAHRHAAGGNPVSGVPENDEAKPMFRRGEKKERPLPAALSTMFGGL